MVVTCEAKRQRGRGVGEPCGGFVADLPDALQPRVVGVLRHSSRRRPGHAVAPCTSCGALNEVELAGLRDILAGARLAV